MKPEKEWMLGDQWRADSADFGNEIAFQDHKIRFAATRSAGKKVLDLGCVQHNPENYRSKFWLHKALVKVAGSVVGIDLYEPGVEFLREKGFDVRLGDVQNLDLGETFDVIVAGDLIEHLDDFAGFLDGCKKHLGEDGQLLISTPNPWYWRNTVKAALRTEVANNPEHTCWLCARTLRQLASRFDLNVAHVEFGSRYLRDRVMPLPRGWKHTSFHAVLTK